MRNRIKPEGYSNFGVDTNGEIVDVVSNFIDQEEGWYPADYLFGSKARKALKKKVAEMKKPVELAKVNDLPVPAELINDRNNLPPLVIPSPVINENTRPDNVVVPSNKSDEPTGWLADEKELGGVTVVGKKKKKQPEPKKTNWLMIGGIALIVIVLIIVIIKFAKK